ncbi:hypothetical protein sos41_21300 [Alphaproteobacteria bacterium SO-S41]|nr:hypothetical protein sos41_21300 [Alphaproteobacteria bacterium SO-S41]
MPLTTADFGGGATYHKYLSGNNTFTFGSNGARAANLGTIMDFKSIDDGISTIDVLTSIVGEMKPLCEELPSNEFRNYAGKQWG